MALYTFTHNWVCRRFDCRRFHRRRFDMAFCRSFWRRPFGVDVLSHVKTLVTCRRFHYEPYYTD